MTLMMIAVSAGIVFCISRVYSLTMLYNLNNRSALTQRSGGANSRQTGDTMNAVCEFPWHIGGPIPQSNLSLDEIPDTIQLEAYIASVKPTSIVT